jgi:broad specificity phosphatase PhoE
MSTLVLVRHGQALLFADDYDRLSAVGETQARRLGEYWGRRGLTFDAVYTGPRERHQRTAELVGECCRQAGLPWPEPITLPGLDEHEAVQLLVGVTREVFEDQPLIQQLAQDYRAANGPADRRHSFQKLFELVIMLWSQDEYQDEGVESWPAFRERVRSAVARMTDGGRGRRVAAFTSAGPIAVALQTALGCPDQTALELGWRLRNGSLTEFVFTRDRFTLDGFNALPHLDDAALWTYL